MTDMQDLKNRIDALGACTGSTDFLLNHRSAQEAWDTCERGSNMLWLLGRLSGKSGSMKRRKLVLAACDCAALARKHTHGAARKAFDRCQRTARDWARGKNCVTLDDVRSAAAAVYAAAWAASAASAVYAASAADAASSAADAAYANAAASSAADAAAADAADAASYAAADAADAADAAAYAASAAAHAATLKRCAVIVRKHSPHPPRVPR